MGFVDTRIDGHVLVIRINRPEKYNALNVAMYHELAQAYAMLGGDPNLRVAVLCAEGKHFTAGIELDEWAPIFRSGQSFPVAAGEIDPMGVNGPLHSKPVVIAVQGCLQATRYALEHDRAESVARMMRDLVPVMTSEDAAEGVRSFIERRKAVFAGK